MIQFRRRLRGVPSPAAVARAVGALLLMLSGVTCRDQPVGPSPVIGSLSVAPIFPSGGQFVGSNLPINNVHAIVTRPSDPTPPLRDVIVPFNLDTDQLQLRLQQIQLESPAESLDVTIELLSGSTVLFSGTQRLEARAGASPPPPAPPLPLTFVGPGATLTTLILAPLDSMLTEGDALPLRVSGEDAAQQPVPNFYVSWSSSDTTIARVNGDGVVTGRVPRGSVYIRARTPATVQVPTGVVESTTVTLVPLPTAIQIVSGDGQSAAVGQPLPQPLVVQVVASDQQGVEGVTVNFAPPTGGSVLPTSAVTDANGMAQAVATMPPTGTTTVSFTAAVTGIGQVTFDADFGAAPSHIWTGAVSTDWNNPANWSAGTVPVSSDVVTIPAGPVNQPELISGNGTTGALVLDGTITMNGSSVTSFGDVSGSGSFVGGGTTGALVMPLAGSTLDLATLSNVFISAPVTLGRTVNITGELNIGGAGNLTFANHTANVSSDFSTSGTATITMTSLLDSLKVQGDVLFDGGSTFNQISNGVIFVRGDFTQAATTSTRSYAPTGTHIDVFNGTGVQTVTFASPGASGSNFETLALANIAGGITLASDVFLSGPVGFATGVPRIARGTGQTLFVAELLANNVTLDNLLVVANNVLITQFDSVTFQNYSPAATPLTITHPGLPAPFVFNGVEFLVTPTSGFYISVIDNAPSDGVPLTIDIVDAIPATGAPFIQTSGGAMVHWPPVGGGGVVVWTGAVSTDWAVAGNWSPAAVPTFADSVEIPAGGNQPSLTANALAGAVHLANGTLTMNGHALSIVGTFATSGSGRLVMTSPADALSIGGNAIFNGADELNFMSAGTILLQGDLTQLAGTSPDSYHPSGTHTTVFAGTNQTISFATPGLVPGSSHLQEVVWTGTGTLTLASAVNAHGTFNILTGTNTTFAGANQLLKVGGFTSGATTTTFDGVQLQVDNPTPTPVTISNLSFVNQSSTVTQLRVSNVGAATASTFSNLTFSSVPTTGFYLSAEDLNPSDGIPFTIDMVNPTPATPGSFVQTAGGAVVNWPAAGGGGIIWNGSISNDWFNAGNWNGGVVPGAADDVQIPGNAPNQPILTNDVDVNNLTTVAGGFIDVDGNDLSVHGHFSGTAVSSSPSGFLLMDGTGVLAAGSAPNFMITGDVSVNSAFSVQSDLSITGSAAHLRMANPGALVAAGGNANFNGANSTGDMTEGSLLILGDLNVLASNTPTAFAPSGNHVTTLSNGTGPQTITLANPFGGNQFHHLNLGTPSQINLGSPVVIGGTLTTFGTGTVVQGSVSNFLIVRSTIVNGLVLDGGPITISNSVATPLIFNDVMFQNQDPAEDQLSVDLPGGPGTHSFSDIVFTDVPTTGTYMTVSDNTADANVLTIDMVSPSPGTDGGFTQTTGGAVINWPAAGGGGAEEWSGAAGNNWNSPGNWVSGNVPNAGDDILIPAGAPNYPSLISSEIVNDLVVEPGAVIDFVDGSLEVTGDLTGGGSMTNGGPNMSGSAKTIEMTDLGALTVTGFITMGSNLLVNGDLVIQGVPAHFDVNGFGLTIVNDLVTTANGTIQMTNPSGAIVVVGSAFFDGGAENGLLTAGLLGVQGNFTQSNGSSPNSFRANGMLTVFDGTAQQTITFSDSLLSFFGDLDLSNTTGGILFNSLVRATNVTVNANVSVTATDQTVNGDGLDVLGSLNAGSGSTLAMGRLYMVGSLSVNGTFSTASVIFQGTGQTAPVLPYQAVFVQVGSVTFAAAPVSMNTLTVASGTLNLGARTTVNGDVIVAGGTLRPNGQTIAIVGTLNVQTTGTVTMQNALDSVLVTGFAGFGGGSSTGLMTNGVLRVSGSFTQTSGTSTTSFAPSGSHKTILGAGAVRVVNFASPGLGVGGSHFARLEVSGASGGLNLVNDIFADTLISHPGGIAPRPLFDGTAAGNSVTVMSLNVDSLIFNNAPLIVNEQGTIRSQLFNRAIFQGFPTTATSAIFMDMTMVGTSVTPRPVTFTAPTVQTSLGTGGLYARLVSSNGPQAVTVTINGSNDPTGGPSRSNPSFGSTVNGARIVWQ